MLDATSPYNTSISTIVSPDNNFTNCNEVKNVTLDVLLSGGTSGDKDSLFVILPEGISYEGSFI